MNEEIMVSWYIYTANGMSWNKFEYFQTIQRAIGFAESLFRRDIVSIVYVGDQSKTSSMRGAIRGARGWVDTKFNPIDDPYEYLNQFAIKLLKEHPNIQKSL